MLRTITIVFICLCFYSWEASAQRKEVSFNTTNVISNIFSLSDQGDLIDPHSLSVRFITPDGEGDVSKISRLRMGVNILSSLSSDEFVGFESRTLDNWSVNLRMGFEQQRFLAEKFEVYYGWEVGILYHLTKSEIIFDFDSIVNTNNRYGVGTGPYMGFQYHFTDRISVYTESNIYFEYNFQEQKLENFGDDQNSSVSSFTLDHFLPNSLYFAIAF